MSTTYDLSVRYRASRGQRGGPEWYEFTHNDESPEFLQAAFAARDESDKGYCDALCRLIDVSHPHRTEEMQDWGYQARRQGLTLFPA